MLKVSLAVALAAGIAWPAMAFEPTKPVEFVVTSGAGGGTDNFARTVQAIIGKYELMPASVIVTNKGGAGGSEGFIYSAAYQDDAHKLTFGTNNEYLLPHVAKVPYKAADFVPVAALALDEFLIWVNGQSPYATAGDFIEDAKSKPGEMRFGGSQPKDTDQTLVAMISGATGTDFRYIPFKGGGEAGTQLAGGHIVANVNNPNENRGQWEAGMVKPLCVFRQDRFPESEPVHDGKGWHDIETCKEAGIAIDEFRMPRTVWMAAGVDPEAVAYYTEVMRKVSETPEWKDYITKTSQTSEFIPGDEFKAYIDKDTTTLVDIYEKEGWLVN